MAATHVRPTGPVVAAMTSVPPMHHHAPLTHSPPHAYPQHQHQHQHHHQHPPHHLSPQHLPRVLINPEVLLEYSVRVDTAISNNHADAHLEHIINNYVAELKDLLEHELNQWTLHVAAKWDVEMTVRPPARTGTKRVHTDDGEDGEDDPPQGNWRCLFYEHDPAQYPQCTKRYKRVSELRRHIKTHTLPHYCEQCGYRTAEERRLTNHKCEESNRKRYPPVTPEEKDQHEKLGRMGVGVGEMRKILFGSSAEQKPDTAESSPPNPSLWHEPSPEIKEEHHTSLMHHASISPTPSNHVVTPPNMPQFSSAPNSAIYAPTSYSPPHTYSPPYANTPVYVPASAPFDPAIPNQPINHSPRGGHAGTYYLDQVEFPGYNEELSPNNMGLSDGSSASPFSNHVTPQPDVAAGIIPPSLADMFDPEDLPPHLRELPTDTCVRGGGGTNRGPGLVARWRRRWRDRRMARAAEAARERELQEGGQDRSMLMPKAPLQSVWRSLTMPSLAKSDGSQKSRLSACVEGLGRIFGRRKTAPTQMQQSQAQNAAVMQWGQPARSEAPAKPEEPAKPKEPAKSEESTQSEKSAQPEPVQPTEEAKPAEAAPQSSELAQLEEPSPLLPPQLPPPVLLAQS